MDRGADQTSGEDFAAAPGAYHRHGNGRADVVWKQLTIALLTFVLTSIGGALFFSRSMVTRDDVVDIVTNKLAAWPNEYREDRKSLIEAASDMRDATKRISELQVQVQVVQTRIEDIARSVGETKTVVHR